MLSPPKANLTAAVAIAVLGQSALQAILSSLNSALIPKMHILIPNFAIVYATCGANHLGSYFLYYKYYLF